jgi:hypothetical protein
MLVPEAPVDQDYKPVSRKHEIWPARQIAPVEPETEAFRM